jgi:hypothetical protein
VNDVVLVLLAPRGIEEALHDWLLDQGVAEFVEQEVLEHGSEHSFETTLDAVRGSRPRVMFQVVTNHSSAQGLLDAARSRWPRVALRYWMMQLLESGKTG